MLESLFGSINRERALLFINARGEGYAREIARFFDAALSPIQKQLDKLEAGNILASKERGRTRIYSFNPRYPFLKELKELLNKAIVFLPENERKRLEYSRRRPRRRGKPL